VKDKEFIFLAGLHRSGTSLLHEIIREHNEISGFTNTDAPEDEGQHLQNVYRRYGGPGKFAFDKRSYMDDTHPLATPETAKIIYEQWSRHYDLSCNYLVEKSPPNLIKTKFLQKLFPNCKFIVILRHPLAVSYATLKWRKTKVKSLIKHSIHAYEIFLEDMKDLDFVYILRYEEFVLNPQEIINDIFSFLKLNPVINTRAISCNINDKYFQMWEKDQKKLLNKFKNRIPQKLENRINKFGYSIYNYNELAPVEWMGANTTHGSLLPNS